MPLPIPSDAPTILVRRAAFERAGLTRTELDDRFQLTPDEFRVEADLITIGPLFGDDVLTELTDMLESFGLTYFDDFFDLSGNWPEWLSLFAMSREGR